MKFVCVRRSIYVLRFVLVLNAFGDHTYILGEKIITAFVFDISFRSRVYCCTVYVYDYYNVLTRVVVINCDLYFTRFKKLVFI